MAGSAQVRWQTGRVHSTTPAAEGIRRIELDLEHPVRVEPGAHVDLRIDSGDVRSYSLVGGSQDGRRITLGVNLSPTSRGGSRFMHSLRPGDTLPVTSPLQNFPLRVGAPRYVLLAGGIGITALAGMASVLRRLGADYTLVFVGRTRGRMAFLEELREAHGENLRVHIDDEGVPLSVSELLDQVDSTTELYMCGPIRLMDAVRREWLQRELPLPNLRYETFGSSGWFQAEEFLVRAPSWGVETVVGIGESLLDALERSGVEAMSDCRKGECGLCVLAVEQLDGAIDHRDVFFSERQKHGDAKLCACVSRVARRKDSSAQADQGAPPSSSSMPSITLDVH
ncbi:PDR/VanB family oxidoreductase [Nesterenkonia sp. K-15-9-6]|uniref:PDR/VanB family oxidoreductase n=1 Tax=Nesterenkonia sp. K-15-9-6 TaxID=3093918 RepID=UPI0040439F8A